MDICQNIRMIEEKIYNVCAKIKRDPKEITILAASKTQPPEKIIQAYECSIRYFGENKVQEGISKIEKLKEYLDIHWHLIGGLQTNKAKYAVRYFEVIHSLDRTELAMEIDKRAGKIGKKQECLIEVNFGEVSKFGIKEEDLFKLFEECLTLENIKITGLMSIPPYSENPQEARPYFERLRVLKESIEKMYNIKLPHLSMGMSHDFEVAIEEGATIVRIGTAIFGERNYG